MSLIYKALSFSGNNPVTILPFLPPFILNPLQNPYSVLLLYLNMKKLILLLFLLPTIAFGQITDKRDGKTYKTVIIGTQEWMAENLAFKPSSGNYWAYDDNNSNVAKYGYLYDWETAQNVCPSGWHLPTDEEWTTLTDYLGGEEVAGTKMKSTSGWKDNGIGTNESGFSGLPGGYRYDDGYYSSIGWSGLWWSPQRIILRQGHTTSAATEELAEHACDYQCKACHGACR
ncbi:MAG TPA: hypothetical protein EYN89_09405, partial [Flavobacteriales bacterium]|nr:hypothetical protein [Flavobacteriales bacterium]